MNCCLCCDSITATTKDIHHRIKRSKGGQEYTINKIAICTRCHRLIHKGEALLSQGRDQESVLDFYRSTLSPLKLSLDLELVARNLYEAAKEAAFLSENAPRVLQPFEVKAPKTLLAEFSGVARDCNVRRNDLILWCMKECVEGRVRLPGNSSR